MTIQGSGTPITLGQIRTELGHSGSIGLRAAEIGTYGAINTNSTPRPDGTTPSLMSEWYGYNHGATPPGPTLYPHVLRFGVDSVAACASGSSTTYYSNCSVLASGCELFYDDEGVTSAFAGSYAAVGINAAIYPSDGNTIGTITYCP